MANIKKAEKGGDEIEVRREQKEEQKDEEKEEEEVE